MITRQEFVSICTQAIKSTRNDIAIQNQVSGYLTFHKEIKENNFFFEARANMEENQRLNGYSLADQHEIIRQSKMGNCHEIAEYLSVEIIRRLKNVNVDARIRILNSLDVDHVYLNLRISLKGEKSSSLWEVDAWDPRVIDITMRRNGTIKNEAALTYGHKTRLHYSTSVRAYTDHLSPVFRKPPRRPVKGSSKREVTPRRDVCKKHISMYKDYTLEDAYAKNKLDEDGEIHHLQKVSNWQK